MVLQLNSIHIILLKSFNRFKLLIIKRQTSWHDTQHPHTWLSSFCSKKTHLQYFYLTLQPQTFLFPGCSISSLIAGPKPNPDHGNIIYSLRRSSLKNKHKPTHQLNYQRSFQYECTYDRNKFFKLINY